MDYPAKPVDGRYEKAFAEIAQRPVPKKLEDSARASSVSYQDSGSAKASSLRPEVQLDLGVLHIWLEGGGRTSQSFNDSDKGSTGDGGEAGFNFCPGEDNDEGSLTIGFEVHHPHNIRSAKMELFCRGVEAALWTKCWGGLWGDGAPISELIPGGKSDGSVCGSLPFQGKVEVATTLEDPQRKDDGPLFPDGLPTVARSPYMLKMTVSGRAGSTDGEDKDHFAYPTTAWTYAHVLVHEIKLLWGDPALIPRQRDDVNSQAKHFKDRTENDNLDQLLARQRTIFDTLSKKPVATAQDIVVDASLYDYTAFATNLKDELDYYRGMWGNGPLLPVLASVTVKTLAGGGLDAPKALGRLRFLWDWQDNVGGTLREHLDGWLNQENQPRNVRATRMSRVFLEALFERLKDERFPLHAFNCPDSHGGKRGAKHPGDATAKVFPVQSGQDALPCRVETAAKRTWAAWSFPAAGLKTHDGTAAHTGVLFQPSTIAGDKYRIGCWVDPGLDDIDVDLVSDACFDLEKEAAAVPHGLSGLYTVWRGLKGTYYATPSFYPTIDATITQIKAQLERELGFKCDLEKKPFPDLQADLGRELDGVIKATNDLSGANPVGRALIVRAAVDDAAVRDRDYAFEVIQSTQAHFDNLEDMFRTNTLSFFHVDDAVRGKEIHGQTSGARGVSLPLRAAFPNLDGHAVLGLNATAFQAGEKVKELSAAGTEHDTHPLAAQPLVVRSLQIDETRPRDAGLKAKTRKVSVRNVTYNTVAPVDLTYSEGIVRATRHISDADQVELNRFLADTIVAAPNDTSPLQLEIVAKTSTTRERERVDEVRRYLEERVVEREKLFDVFKADTMLPALTAANTHVASLAYFNSQTVSPAWRKVFNEALLKHAKQAAENSGWETEGRSIFYHLRGRTKLDKDFTTGGIENNFCEEKLGLAGLTVPAPTAAQRVDKRWLKSPLVVAVHEFGHTLMLTHSLPRVFDTKIANSTTTDHLAHDSCIMNYDADSSSFCSHCMLRKRGWDIAGIETNHYGHPTEASWGKKALKAMEDDIAADDDDVAAKVRLAMFSLVGEKYLADATDRTAQARQLMADAEAKIPVDVNDEQYIWLLRNLIVFYSKLIAKVPNGADQTKLEQAIADLTGACTHTVDIDVTVGATAQTLGIWTHEVR